MGVEEGVSVGTDDTLKRVEGGYKGASLESCAPAGSIGSATAPGRDMDGVSDGAALDTGIVEVSFDV